MSGGRHERVQRQLPGLVEGDLSWWRRRLVQRHLDHCVECRQEEVRQRRVAASLDRLGEEVVAPLDDAAPPPDLLQQLLDDVGDPGLRQRVAVPARGAVSGARPGLSLALVLILLSFAAGAVWLGWRLVEVLDARRGD